MGNRIQGFLAGVFITGSLTAATVGTIQGQQSVVSGLIRNCERIIQKRILSDEELREAQIPISKRVNVEQRPSVWETCKDIWNDEIIKGVNSVYAINWYQLGITTDKKINNLVEWAMLSVSDKK